MGVSMLMIKHQVFILMALLAVIARAGERSHDVSTGMHVFK